MEPLRNLLSPLGDVVFKLLMGDPARPGLMIAFLHLLVKGLNVKGIEGLRFIDPQQRGDAPGDKLGILDLLAELSTGELVNVEVQLRAHRWLRERLLFYGARLLTGQFKTGDEYKKLSRSICIVIADDTMFPEDNILHHQFRLYDPAAEVEFTDKLEIHTLELPKLPAQPGDTDAELWGWMRFLSAETEEDYKMAIKTAPVLEEAYDRLVKLSEDEETRMLAEAREKQRRDNVALLESSYLDGEEAGEARGVIRGRVEGEEKAKAGFARRLLQTTTMPHADIAQLTALSITDIERLAGEGKQNGD